MFAINIEKLETLKYHLFKKKTSGLSVVYSKCVREYQKKKTKKTEDRESIEISNIVGLITNIEE